MQVQNNCFARAYETIGPQLKWGRPAMVCFFLLGRRTASYSIMDPLIEGTQNGIDLDQMAM